MASVIERNASGFLSGSSKLAALIRTKDWSKHSLGTPDSWPVELKTSLSLILNSQFPMFISWGNERTFFYNDAYSVILGAKHPLALGGVFHEIWSDIWKDLENIVEQVEQGTATYFENLPLYMNRHGEFEQTHFTFSYSPIMNQQGKLSGLFCVCVETTETVRSQAVLQAAQINYERSVDNSPAILWITEKDGSCSYLSKQWYEFTGQTKEEALGFGWLEATHPSDKERTAKIYIEANEKQVPFYAEYRLKTKDGTYRWAIDAGNPRYDKDGNYLGYAGTVFDIHDRKIATEQIRDLQYRFERSAQATNLGVWYCDLPFDVLIWNEEVKRHFFLPPDARVTIDIFYQRIHPDDREPTRKAIQQSIDTHMPYDTVYRTTNPVNPEDIKFIRAVGWTDYNEQGEPIRFDGITLDVSPQLLANQELKAAKEEAERANQLKSAFLANMSHEIRTPLGAMMGFADLLRDPGLTVTERQSFTNILSRNGESLSVIINDILDLSKVEAGHLTLEYTDTSPHEIGADVISLLRVKANEKDLVLEYTHEENSPQSIVADPTRVRQILLNLVGNAIKFTEFGSVKLRSFACKSDSGRDALCFEITDTGIGVAESQRENIFEMFVQADGSMTRRFGGTGLGLALSRHLARAMGGDIVLLQTQEGVGSTFLVTIEDQPEKRNDSSAKAVRAFNDNQVLPEKALEGVKILVVDDAPDNQQLIWRYLTKQGAIVTSAENGFLGYRAALMGNFDLVLMDIQMPVMDGYAATQKLREAGYRKPIVALTAHAMSEVRKKALNVGYSDHLTKPINPKELISTIARYVEKLHP